MSVRIGINGFGRIGKLVFRLSLENPDVEVVHLNDKMDTDFIAYLLKHDSLHGILNKSINYGKDFITVGDKKILVTKNTKPNEIDWEQKKVDVVVDATGKFKSKELLQGHFNSNVKKVILTCPPNDNSIDRVVVLGVNEKTISSSDKIVSNASCTTNCVAIMLKVLKDQFGVNRAFMNTVHPATNNQNIQDAFHSDFRRSRSVLNNIIPTTTSATRCIPMIFPDMHNIFDGFATRVPVAECSFVELIAELEKNVSVDDINNSFKEYSKHSLKRYLEYSSESIVSTDIINNSYSAVFDSLCTKVIDGNLVQILGWYDNEFAYSSRVIELINYLSDL